CGIFKQRAGFLKSIAKDVMKNHGGIMPLTEEWLLHCPGVGRKTLVLFQNEGIGLYGGLGVDVHVTIVALCMDWLVIGPQRHSQVFSPELAERSLRAWIPVFRYKEFNRVMGTMGQLLTQEVDASNRSGNNRQKLGRMAKCLSETFADPSKVELMWFFIRKLREQPRDR
ncbi:MAG: hypothetical protein SGARI_003282, partial [Bacillariaceae sp.]